MNRWLGFAVLMVFSTNAVAGSVSKDLVTDTFATAVACYLFESDGADGFPAANLSPQQLAEAVRDYTPGLVFTDDEIEAFYWRAAVPAACEIHQNQKLRYGIYVLDVVLSAVDEVSEGDVGWSDLRERATGQACDRLVELAERVEKDAIQSVFYAFEKHLDDHPVFSGAGAPDDLARIKSRWRAYWLGRYRERELSQQAVEDYAAAFEAFPEQVNRHELKFDEIALPLFYTSEQFSQERLATFGPVSPGGERGLDLQSYIARQQAWNFLFSVETGFPVQAPDNDRVLEMKDDLILHLRGKVPGPEACHPVDYWEVRGNYNAILHDVVEFVDEQLVRRLNALVDASSQLEFQRIQSGASMSSIVEPAVDEWTGPDCALPIVRASYRLIPGSQSLSDGLIESGYVYLDSNSPDLEETLLGASIEYGLGDEIRNSGWELDADQAERIRREDVVSELWRTVLDRLDLVEIDVCNVAMTVPFMPGNRVSVPSIQVREVERLWQR